MEKLFILLELQRRSQESASRQTFAHVVVNDTHKLVPYKQAIFWGYDGDKARLEKVSGTSVLDDKGPYALSLQELIEAKLKADEQKTAVTAFSHDQSNYMLLKFQTAKDGLIGGLLLERKEIFADADTHILEELSVSYAHALALLNLRSQSNIGSFFTRKKRYKKQAIAALLVLMFFPVRLSVTAPAEIVTRDAEVVTIPYDGMPEKINVSPGDEVKAGQVLAVMEHSALTAQMDIAQQELTVTQSSAARLSRQSLAAPERKSDLTAALSEIQNKKVQFEHARTLSERSQIKASRDGVAVFADVTALQGKPMMTGDKLMMIADSSAYDVLIRVPVDAMVPLSADASATFYLNVSPLSGYDAQIKSIGYQASPDPDGLLTYKIHAVPVDAEDIRIGWKGTARIHGTWTILSYAILRRPLAALRHITGL